MVLRQIHHVNDVPHPRTIGGGVVATKDIQKWTFARRNLHLIVHQGVGNLSRVVPYESAWMSPRRVEMARATDTFRWLFDRLSTIAISCPADINTTTTRQLYIHINSPLTMNPTISSTCPCIAHKEDCSGSSVERQRRPKLLRPFQSANAALRTDWSIHRRPPNPSEHTVMHFGLRSGFRPNRLGCAQIASVALLRSDHARCLQVPGNGSGAKAPREFAHAMCPNRTRALEQACR